jgi:septum formation protein
VQFEVMPPGVPEDERPGEDPTQLALRLAGEKALAVAARVGSPPRRWVLGADTLVVVEDRVLGKPENPEHAVALLCSLLGRCHRVITGVALADSQDLRVRDRAVESTVEMRCAGEDEVRAYVATGEPLDKAGAYGFQGQGRRFVVRVTGSETNVIGLPLEETLALLREAGALP